MCGIAGAIRGDPSIAVDVVRGMTHWQAHRGPDSACRFSARFGPETIALGHGRLAIIVQTDAGAQPITSAQRRRAVYNGELYNFRELRRDLAARGCQFRRGRAGFRAAARGLDARAAARDLLGRARASFGIGLVEKRGADAAWSAFAAAPDSPAWSRVFARFVLGRYLNGALDVAQRRRKS